MDLNRSRLVVLSTLISLSIGAHLYAAPKLRLDKTTIGPISIATGANGPSQTVNANNAGDQPLHLTATSSASWLSATVQPIQSCGTLGANCSPIIVNLSTQSLAKGTYTGTLTISDPNAIDAPQTITVTVFVGGGIPDNLTFYVPSNGTPVTQSFSAARAVSTTVSQPGQVSLSVAAPSAGSFATIFPYTVTAKANVGTADGSYNGSILVTGSSIGAENKTVPVTLNVTSQPIASPSQPGKFRIAQGASKQLQYIVVSNASGGTLAVSNASAVTTSGGNWLTTSVVSGIYVGATADPAGLAPGTYNATVTIASNAANSTITVPIELNVLATGPPVARPFGVVNNATFEPGAQLAQGDLPAIFGEQFTTGDVQLPGLPLPTSAGGATVYLNDVAVPIYYLSATQINFLIPVDAKVGEGVIRVDRDGQRGNSISVIIAKSAPKLTIAVTQSVQVVSTPFGGPSTPVTAGQVVTIYGVGFGQTTPPVATGQQAPSNPLAMVPGLNNLVYFGAGGLFKNPVSQVPQFIGLTPGGIGLYQINVQIPANAPKGAAVPVFIQGDVGTSNILNFNIQ